MIAIILKLHSGCPQLLIRICWSREQPVEIMPFKKKLLISEALFVVILSFNQNRFSGLSYSLNSASFKAENSLNRLVFFSVSIIL